MIFNYKHTNYPQMNFADLYLQKRIEKNKFFSNLDKIIDWNLIEKELKKVYKKGLKERGCKAYNPLILFKMQLISIWYNLSDVRTEEMVYDSFSAMNFCGLTIEDSVPDHSTISRFRKELTEKKAYDRLLKKVNQQLIKKKLILKGGVNLDASLTESPFNPKGKLQYEIAEDRKEDKRNENDIDNENKDMIVKEIEQPNSDTEARWLKKRGKSTFGYKKHMAVDDNGIILTVFSTTANEHDSKGLEAVVTKLGKGLSNRVKADKGYTSKKNKEVLKKEGFKSGLMYKAQRNKPLTPRQQQFNRIVSKTRWVVERTFGSLKRWFGSGVTRLKGLNKNHGLHVLESIAHNLKRSPGLVYQMAKN